MKKVTLRYHDFDFKALRTKFSPSAREFDTVLDEPCVGVDEKTGQVSLVLLKLSSGFEPLLRAARALKYRRSNRTQGLVSPTCRVFGSMPREKMRKDFCSVSQLSRESPAEHAAMCDQAAHAADLFERHAPEAHAAQRAMLEGVLPEWRLPGGVFTSGIANHDNQLAYHKDSGNFAGAWSCMYAFQHDMRGGYLVLPEHRIAVSFSGAWLVMFDGARRAHGVTPMVRKSQGGYRYSVVYYALKAMCNCLSVEGELERIRAVKSEREAARLLPREEQMKRWKR